MLKLKTRHDAMAARYRRSLFLSAAIIALAAATGAQMARAQSVTGAA